MQCINSVTINTHSQSDGSARPGILVIASYVTLGPFAFRVYFR